MKKELEETKTYNVLEIIPHYLAGKKVKRDCWLEVEYLQFNKEMKPKRVSHSKLGNITIPGLTSCRIKLKQEEEQDNNKSEMLDKYECYYSSPLESLDKFGCDSEKLWIIV